MFVVAPYWYSAAERACGTIAVAMKSVIVVTAVYFVYNYPTYFYYLHLQQLPLLCILVVQLEDFDVHPWTNP